MRREQKMYGQAATCAADLAETVDWERAHNGAPAVRLPELLAPAGDWDCARAAIENGADAIYFGLDKFNARMRAHNFTETDLPRLMEFLHRRGAKGYVTFNTLVFENELAEAEQYTRSIVAAGVDAAIVQDVGICRLIRWISPDFPIHVSTQMTVTSAAGIEFARELGCDLVVLARECSLQEIKTLIGNEHSDLPNRALPLEVFIHGALCVAYSGQCLTSEALGGRSANRGECAQACRMPYELISDGRLVPLGERKYLLSPQDLSGLEVLPELVRLGVASLKIEGRLKSPEYVANITRIYRAALDKLAQSHRTDPVSLKAELVSPKAVAISGIPRIGPRGPSTQCFSYEMEMAFSRGLHTGWFNGTDNQALVHGRFGKKRGVFLGPVLAVARERVLVRLEGPLKPGDGVVFDAGRPEEKEEGGRVYEIKKGPPGVRANQDRQETTHAGGDAVWLTFGRRDIQFHRVRVGDRLWKTSDPELDRALRRTFEASSPKFQRPIDIETHGLAGKPLTIVGRDELGHVVRIDSSVPLVAAQNVPLTTERLRQQLGRFGGTAYELGELKNSLEGQVLLPISELNRLRRQLVEELDRLRAKPPRWTLAETSRHVHDSPLDILSRASDESPAQHPSPANPGLTVLVRNLAQLESALNCGIQTVYCDFEDPKKYREAVARFRSQHGDHRTEASGANELSPGLWVAPPRIFKTGEDWTLKQVRSCEADGYLVRNYDHLAFFAADRRIGDYSLNIANALAANYFRNKFGLERVTASYDLNFGQLEALLRAAPPGWFEVTIHQHIPMFHMEHCVFCAFLSNGTNYTNCGRPCDKHDLKLRDRVGAQHPVKADVGCRNTVFNALAQTGAEYVERMLALGVRVFRLEFLTEPPEQVTATIEKYRQLLRGEITGSAVWRELKLLNQLGVTRGQIAGQHR
jgi:U32 family peptidase